MKRISLVAILIVLFLSGMAFATPVDLSQWTTVNLKPFGGGNWVVSNDNTSVIQTKNGQPTIFVSDISYINHEFSGNFEVQTTYDDDFIGFVFGYTNDSNYYLFDWKQNAQWGAPEGFTLSHVTGSHVNLWYHFGPGINVMNTSYSTTSGWQDYTLYNFNLNYTQSGFTIDIDGDPIFAETGVFEEGRFGFYNYSQSQVFYQGFETTLIPTLPNPVPAPATIYLLGSGLLSLVGIGRKKLKK